MSSYNICYNEVIILSGKLSISKKTALKGDDGHKTFSIRVKDETIEKLDELVKITKRSRNELINMMIEYGLENYTIDDNS